MQALTARLRSLSSAGFPDAGPTQASGRQNAHQDQPRQRKVERFRDHPGKGFLPTVFWTQRLTDFAKHEHDQPEEDINPRLPGKHVTPQQPYPDKGKGGAQLGNGDAEKKADSIVAGGLQAGQKVRASDVPAAAVSKATTTPAGS